MSRLSLANSLVTSKNRIPSILIDEEFASGTGGFTFTATTGSNDSGTLKTIASGVSTPHYAYQILQLTPGVSYKYSVQLVTSGLGGGHIWIGSGVGNNDIINHDAPSATTYTGTFDPDHNLTIIVLHLVGDNNNITTKWNDILIEEDN